MATEFNDTHKSRSKADIIRNLSIVFIVLFSILGWRINGFYAAIRELREAGLHVTISDPFEKIQKDWSSAFKLSTWKIDEKTVRYFRGCKKELSELTPSIHRVQPLTLEIK